MLPVAQRSIQLQLNHKVFFSIKNNKHQSLNNLNNTYGKKRLNYISELQRFPRLSSFKIQEQHSYTPFNLSYINLIFWSTYDIELGQYNY